MSQFAHFFFREKRNNTTHMEYSKNTIVSKFHKKTHFFLFVFFLLMFSFPLITAMSNCNHTVAKVRCNCNRGHVICRKCQRNSLHNIIDNLDFNSNNNFWNLIHPKFKDFRDAFNLSLDIRCNQHTGIARMKNFTSDTIEIIKGLREQLRNYRNNIPIEDEYLVQSEDEQEEKENEEEDQEEEKENDEEEQKEGQKEEHEQFYFNEIQENELDYLRNENNALKVALKNLRNENNNLKEKLDQFQHENNTIKEKLDQSQQENNTIKEKLDQSQNENKDVNLRLSFENLLQSLQHQINHSLKRNFNQMNNEISSNQKQI
ncbi:hypothetical protein RFI_22627 [Reticulomyxa filosa]|uniref:Uncharacterized protein n=1 Tax=Reticulomyxa filosa TaxID=46433 RepID=X6ML52_RETFI|nr:hypothetical protein RFI_22627 [Reticulomyxa filosa]|eukprot:ETO14743.1 hypothetical protein RFI_22627 [Reticulomyxa filosa]